MSKFLEWYEKQSVRLRLIFVIISGVALATSLTFSWTGNADKIAGFDPAWIAIVLCGLPIVLGAIVGVVKDHRSNLKDSYGEGITIFAYFFCNKDTGRIGQSRTNH